MSAPNSVPRFVLDPVVGAVEISSANTARDGTGATGSLLIGGTNGTLVELIRVIARGTTTAGMIRLFIVDGSSVAFLYDEIPVTAVTPSGTVACFEAELIPTKPLVLPQNYELKCSTHNAEMFHVFATGGQY